MDVNFKLDNYTFNYRVAGIIKHNDKYLVNVRSESNYVSLIGGRCMIGETSVDAIKREIMEETGNHVKVNKLLGIVENFFDSRYGDGAYHEILFIYDVSFIDSDVYLKDGITNLEDKHSNSVFTWKTIDEIRKEDFEPKDILDCLNKDEVFHKILK